MSILVTGLQNRVKNSSAYSEDLGIMLICNGEEMPYILTPQGTIYPAGISAPTVAPTVADDGAGNLLDTKWVIYVAVYVSENVFPSVAARLFGNPSGQSAPYQITGGGNRKNDVTVTGTTEELVTHIRLYRTALCDTQLLAETAADAGLMYLIGDVANPGAGTAVIEDNLEINIGNDVVDFTNFTVPQFRFCVYDGSYFWGFANQPYRAEAVWDTDGTFNSTEQFWGGRDDQYITFDGITTGGIDGRGTYLFRQTGSFTGKVVDENGDDTTLPNSNSGYLIIQGEPSNLYRSKYRNPFSWGYERNIAGEYIPERWELKVSGALGTAIALIPDQYLLKLDMEFPALCITYNLQTAGTDVFAQTRRQVSRLYSVTSHFSQFPAVSNGRQVLWGMDFKNLCILESDGVSQVPVSGPVSTVLRMLSRNRAYHLISHGVYDATTETNCIWLSSIAADGNQAEYSIDLCVYQHVPTGFWGLINDYGILSSATVEDVVTTQRKTLVGTEFGFFGRAFDPDTYGNWIPTSGLYAGTVGAVTENSITRTDGEGDFNTASGSIAGNYVMLVSPDGLTTHVCNILSFTEDTLTFDVILDPAPQVGWQFFIGLIELSVLKYFNRGTPAVDKAAKEFWATLTDAVEPKVLFYPSHSETPIKQIELQQDTDLDAYKNKLDFPTKKYKSYGLKLVERSYSPTRFYDFSVKE